MTEKMNFQRNLVCMQDLLLGTGTVTQVRGNVPMVVNKINAALFPYDDELTLQQKLDTLTNNHYVDEDNLPVYVATPHSFDDLNIPNVIWVKDISATEAEVYYYNVLLFSYNPTTGNLNLAAASFDTAKAEIEADYTAADEAVTTAILAQLTAYIASQVTLHAEMEAAWKAADTESLASLSLGSASTKDVGTGPLNVVQLNSDAKLPAIDGSNLTNLAAATLPVGATLNEQFVETTSATAFSNLIPRAGSAPANTEGAELLTTTITPSTSGNKLAIRFRGSAHPSAVGVAPAALLFINGTFVKGAYSNSANGGPLYPSEVSIEHMFTTTSADPVVIAIRTGPTINAGEIRWNDNSWGATGKGASLSVREIKV
ncbi:MAG: hypothetical protein EOM35_02200 [Negativicutes bacterium]|nr:hypothetical protein [Negativicutes bacterium]